MRLFKKNSDTADKQERDGSATEAQKNGHPWILWGIAVCLTASVLFSCFYKTFRTNAEASATPEINQYQNMEWLLQNAYLLYVDLLNAQNGTFLDYSDAYLKPDEGYEWLLEEGSYEGGDYEYTGYDALSGVYANLSETVYEEIRAEVASLEEYFSVIDSSFYALNSNYDYIIRDDKTGKYVGNISNDDYNSIYENPYFLLSFSFDSAGHISVEDVVFDEDEREIRRLANETIRNNMVRSTIEQLMKTFSQYGCVTMPVDCTVIFAISKESQQLGLVNYQMYVASFEAGYDTYSSYVLADYAGYVQPSAQLDYYMYANIGVAGVFLYFFLAVILLAIFLPVKSRKYPWDSVRICSLPLEVIVTVGFLGTATCAKLVIMLVAEVASGSAVNRLIGYFGGKQAIASGLVMVSNLAALTFIMLFAWYLGICTRAVREKGLKNYIKQRSLIYGIFPFIKSKLLKGYRAIEHMDLTQNSNREILKIILVNAVILFIISSLGFGGFAITVVYSILLYIVLRKYISGIQKNYRLLLKAANEIAEGNLGTKIEDDMGIFEPFKPEIIKIQNGFQKAVDEEVKSQKMKAELITNVSHDLKTPLTAIITYVNLLKDDSTTAEQRKEYLDILERKSLRLKSLIEDLFEISKANSDNITLNYTNVDVMSLIKQVAFEMSDKLSAAALDIRLNLTEEKITLSLDSQKTYRIYENLFGNIAKYAMPGTRVYVNGFRVDNKVVITLKNISAQELSVDSNELTERFVRGDSSRNTEGSGLGLAIAKRFMELQGGELQLDVDGDLFKVTTVWTL